MGATRTNRFFILLILLIVTCFSSLFSQSVNVPLDYWAYNFLERLETKGYFRSLLLRTRPLSRGNVAQLLAEVEENLSSQAVKLSQSELDLFQQLKGEFHEELSRLDVTSQPQYHERHLIQWSEGTNTFKIDVAGKQLFDIFRGDQYDGLKRTSRTTAGGIVRGNLQNSLAFNIDFHNTLIRGESIERENFNPSIGMPTVISGENVYQDDASAYLVWKLPWFYLEFGRDQAQWGPGYQGSLMLSQNNPLFDLLKLSAQFERFHFTSIHGKLNSEAGNKYLAAHRLEVRVTPWFYLAGSEAVVYGGRGIEPQYLNPIMPYHIAEHHLGDKDNNTLGFDFTLFPIKRHKVYGELFIDDFTSSENPFTYFGNKFAFTLGHFWVNPFGIPNVDFRTEYTRIEPYVYTHRDSINIYQHYNQSIGHWLGPNSDLLYFESNVLINRDLSVQFLAERIRQGKGDINTPHQPEDGTKKSFLSGTVESQWRFGLSVRDQIMRDFFLTLSYHAIDTDNLNRIPDKTSLDHQIIFLLEANW